MVKKLITFIMLISIETTAQNYPVYGPETEVTITGWNTDAMEPFISPDGTTLFFNSLNSGGDTRLYYASRVNDSTFTFIGEVNGANEPANPQLNAVASLDTTNNFVWVSVRGWPFVMENLHRGDYSNGTITNVHRMHGTFYIYQPGYLIMDAAVTYNGSQLYYCNAFFDSCTVPCTASLGIASKVNDSTFNTIANSAALLQHVNDTDYCVYAPQLSTDGLELYFTRFLIGGFNTEICVSVRNSPIDTFSVPQVLVSDFPNVPEAASLNTQMTLMYYHKKVNGVYTIHLRERILTDVFENQIKNEVKVYPNPANDEISFAQVHEEIRIYNSLGQMCLMVLNTNSIDVAMLPEGSYFVRLVDSNVFSVSTFNISR